MSSSLFRFKQFDIDQAGCAMKVNTDAVLLAALVNSEQPRHILDVGTGTGVIALMLAQRYARANIEGVEIDETAAEKATLNFCNSPFANRLTSVFSSFGKYLKSNPEKRYDLIISNPPFFINSQKSIDPGRMQARHTSEDFFRELITGAALHLTPEGELVLILPLQTGELVKACASASGLHVSREILIGSYRSSAPHRSILQLGSNSGKQEIGNFVIYQKPGIYTDEYALLLKNFLTIF